MAIVKKRLDLLIQERYPHLSRNQIQSFIVQRKVSVLGIILDKPGTQIAQDSEIILAIDEPKYVSRAGFKLEGALDAFNINVTDLVVLDAGISTGGFSDCLLQRNIKKIYGIDVGYGQVHEKVANNPKVKILERTNLRNLSFLPEKIDIATLDLSFISLLKVIPAVKSLLKPDGRIIALIKPQFEAERKDVGKGGIIKDDTVHQKVIANVTQGMQELGFKLEGLIESPIKGSSGNKEFLGYFIPIALNVIPGLPCPPKL